MVPFEDDNTEAFKLLTRVEIGIRELLRKSLQQTHGNSWRRQLPALMRSKIHAAQNEETQRSQFDFLRLGPLYYLTFGELLDILQQPHGKLAVECAGGVTIHLAGPASGQAAPWDGRPRM